MARQNWIDGATGDWADPADWKSGSVPGSADQVIIGGVQSYEVSISGAIGVASLSISNALATLHIYTPEAIDTITGGLNNAGTLYVDVENGQGGSTVSIGGTLTNSGLLQVGNGFYQNLDATSTVTAAHLDNTGRISLLGNTTLGTTNQATLDVAAGVAPGTLDGVVDISLKGDALLEYASGGITSISAGAQLMLDGAQSRIADKSHPSTNSALTGLDDNAGSLTLGDGASIANGSRAFTNSGTYTIFDNVVVRTNLDFTNSGNVYIDSGDQDGGSSLAVAGTLSNSDVFQVGSSFYHNLAASSTVTVSHLDNTGKLYLLGNTNSGTTFRATLIDTGDAAQSVLSGQSISLAGDALLQFASGGITSIAADAQLSLDGAESHLADKGHVATSSALTGLDDNEGGLTLGDGAAIANSAVAFDNGGTYTLFNQVSVKTNMDFTNGGSLFIDSGDMQGSSRLTVGGTLTNSGKLQVGSNFYQNLAASSTVTTAHLINTNEIDLFGNATMANQATLNVTKDAAPDTLASGVSINLSGDALLEFLSGSIVSISDGAQLTLDGALSFVADKTNTTGNGALARLDDNAGHLEVANGADVITNHGINFANSGTIDVNDAAALGGTIDLGGKLTNTGTIALEGSSGNVATLTVGGNAGNSATLTIGDFAAVTLAGTSAIYAQTAGQTEILGALTAPTIVVSGGLFEATGTVTGNVNVTGGNVAGGLITESAFGTMTIEGSYTQTSGGTMDASILADGSGQSTNIDVSGAVHLNGTLALTIENPQSLSVGETFTVMTFAAGSLQGKFTGMTDGSFTGSATRIVIDGGTTLDASYNNSTGDVQLTVVAAPGGPAIHDAAGQHVFDFAAVAPRASQTTIADFDFASDRFHFAAGITGIDSQQTATQFSDLASAEAHIASHHASLFTVADGSGTPETFLIVDANGMPGFQAGQDIVIRLEGSSHSADFGLGSFV